MPSRCAPVLPVLLSEFGLAFRSDFRVSYFDIGSVTVEGTAPSWPFSVRFRVGLYCLIC